MKQLFIIITILSLCACAPQRPITASSYPQNTTYPQQTENFVLQEEHLYPDPLAGVKLQYLDIDYLSDNISIYIYPIPSTSWENHSEITREEVQSALNEIDYMIRQGYYDSRGKETLSEFSFTNKNSQYQGSKARFSMKRESQTQQDSEIFVFIDEDKFVKFRISFDSQITSNHTGDVIVKELLPLISAPKESAYMQELREEHKQAQTQQLLQLLLQAAQEQSNEQ